MAPSPHPAILSSQSRADAGGSAPGAAGGGGAAGVDDDAGGTLESLTIGYAGRCHLTSLSQAPLARLGYQRQDGACIEIPDARSSYRIPIRRVADGIIIDLPAKMLNRKTRTLTVSWIDAYRH